MRCYRWISGKLMKTLWKTTIPLPFRVRWHLEPSASSCHLPLPNRDKNVESVNKRLNTDGVKVEKYGNIWKQLFFLLRYNMYIHIYIYKYIYIIITIFLFPSSFVFPRCSNTFFQTEPSNKAWNSTFWHPHRESDIIYFPHWPLSLFYSKVMENFLGIFFGKKNPT